MDKNEKQRQNKVKKGKRVGNKKKEKREHFMTNIFIDILVLVKY
jgi:hypothetical protein